MASIRSTRPIRLPFAGETDNAQRRQAMRLNQSMWSLAMRWLSTAVMRGRDASPGAFAGACLLLFASVSAHASEEMGPVYVVKSDPSIPTTIFAGAERGLFKSTDAGATWAATGLNETTTAVAIAPVTPTIVYAGTNSGLFQSSDGGTNWSPAGVSNPICAVEVDPATP